MLWTIAVVLIILWMLGLGNDLAMGLFIHVFYAAAVALLVVSLSREATDNRLPRHISRGRGPNARPTTRSGGVRRWRHGPALRR